MFDFTNKLCQFCRLEHININIDMIRLIGHFEIKIIDTVSAISLFVHIQLRNLKEKLSERIILKELF